MTDADIGGPSLIKLGKLANARDFDKLDGMWEAALNNGDYSWRELAPIAGQVGRQNAADRAAALLETLIAWVAEKNGEPEALAAAREAARQVPRSSSLRKVLRSRYLKVHGAFTALPSLLDLLLPDGADLAAGVAAVERYLQLQPGAYAVDRTYLMPGRVESVAGDDGGLVVMFGDRRAEYGPGTVEQLKPRPADDFAAMALYAADDLRAVARRDPPEFLMLILRSSREQRVSYKELKGHVTGLLGEKGWKDWWRDAKPALKRNPHVGMSDGSQPQFRLLRQADHYEERLRREFDLAKTPLDRLQKVMAHLDELSREERSSAGGAADPALLAHFGNGAAKVAVAVLAENPALALAGLALHAEIAARGIDVARPNPKAAGQVLGRIDDPAGLSAQLPEGLLQRVLAYLRQALPDRWGQVWAAVLTRAGRRLCDSVARELVEAKQLDALGSALAAAVERPTTSPELLGWLWRNRFAGGPAAAYLNAQPELSERRVTDAMFALLDSAGKLYGMSLEERHLKMLESARATLATQSYRPVLGLIDAADRAEAQRLKGIIEHNAGLSPAQRTQLLGYLRSRFADIFVEATREWEDGAVIYTTESKGCGTQASLQHIIDVEIPEVARQIGEAASHGDLSENSEYTAALEKRDQLASRATRLESELSAARVINHEMARSAYVNVGTRVTARLLESGAEEVFTFLGPWDTDVESRVLNYQAPLAQAFMGKRVGEQVTYGDDGQQRIWELGAIEPAPGI